MPGKHDLKDKAFSERYAIANMRRMAAYLDRLADHQEKQMSQRAINENAFINRLAVADAKVVDLTSQLDAANTKATDLQSQVTALTTERDALKAQVPDAADIAVDARAAAILAGNPDPGDPLAQSATGETLPVVPV